MDKYQKVRENVEKLHKLNFTEIIKINDYNDNFDLNESYYDFNAGKFRSGVDSCCDTCVCGVLEKEDTWKKSDKDLYDKYYKDYKLKYVSHGSHSYDFLNAAGVDIEKCCGDWNDSPVLFLMENPSLDYGFYGECSNGKHPTNTWYWIHKRLKKPSEINLDDDLKQAKYGDMVYALICEYSLSNAYVTNAIKCSLNGQYKDGKKGYLGTSWYHSDCKSNCVKNLLAKEIECLTNGYDSLKIFAFGSNAYWIVKEYLENDNSNLKEKNIQLVQLPHPSSRIKNLYRRYAVKGIMKDVLDNDSTFNISQK